MKSLIAALLLAVASGAVAVPCVKISLRPEVSLDRPQVFLGDVAVLRTADLALIRKLVDLPVGQLNVPGSSLVLGHAALQERLRSLAGVPVANQAWTGPDGVRVSTQVQHVGGRELVRVAQTALRKRFPEARLHLAQEPRDIDLWPGALRIQARPLDHANLQRRIVVWVDVWSGERHVRAWPVAFEVAVPFTDVRLPLVHAGDPAQVTPTVGPEASSAVSRGEWVLLRTAVGQVLTEARVQVLQGGRIGEAVQIRHSGGAQALTVRVAGPGQVELP